MVRQKKLLAQNPRGRGHRRRWGTEATSTVKNNCEQGVLEFQSPQLSECLGPKLKPGAIEVRAVVLGIEEEKEKSPSTL